MPHGTGKGLSAMEIKKRIAMRRALMSLAPLGIPELVAQGANQDCEQTLGGLADEENQKEHLSRGEERFAVECRGIAAEESEPAIAEGPFFGIIPK